jgi:hypothetical protein
MRLDVEISGDAQEALARAGEDASAAIRRGLEWVGQELSSSITRNAPVKSGRLRTSIHPTGVVSDDGELKVGIITPEDGTVLKYARVRDEGTGYLPGGVIRAKTSKGLFFPVAGAAFTASGVGGMSYGQAKGSGLAKGTEWRRVMSVSQEGSGYLTKTAEREAPGLVEKYLNLALRDL